eukprot:gene4358-4939_t
MLVEVNYRGKKMVVKWEEGTGFSGLKKKIAEEVIKNRRIKFVMCGEDGKRLEDVNSVKIVHVKVVRRKKYARKGESGSEEKQKQGVGKNYTFNFYQ